MVTGIHMDGAVSVEKERDVNSIINNINNNNTRMIYKTYRQ